MGTGCTFANEFNMFCKIMETETNDGYMPASISKKFQSKLDLLKRKSDWNGLITMLKRYASRYPMSIISTSKWHQYIILIELENIN